MLLVIAVVIVAVALALRSEDASTGTSTTLADGGQTTTEPSETSTSETSTSEASTSAPTTTTVVPSTVLPPDAAACDLFGSIEVLGSIASPDLVEASGMAVSRAHADVLWAHNDSRGGPILHAFAPDGSDLGAFEVPDAFAIDWEDMGAGPDASGSGSYLYVGDMGDNFGIRGGALTVWRVPDEAPSDLDGRFSESQPFPYVMPGGPFDAEALFIDPVDPALYVITKSRTEAFVFRGSLEPTSGARDMELVATLFLDAEVSGADISPDGRLIALRGYESVWLFRRLPGQTIDEALRAEPCLAPSPEERQGEAITIDGTWSYYTVSEGSGPDVNYVPADR